MTRLVASLIGAFVLGASGGCSSPAPTGAPDSGGCAPFVSSDGPTTPVSFADTVMPIFQHSCAIAGQSCHGAPSVTTNGRPYLGSPAGGTPASLVQQQIVAVPSTEDTAMKLVTPNDPANSFLMHKIDGDQCTLAAQCSKSAFPDCGQQMPWNSGTIDATSREAIRAWIRQGAQNN